MICVDMCRHGMCDMLRQDINFELLFDETLSHQVNYMLLHPDVQAKVQDEVDQVLLGFSEFLLSIKWNIA